MNESDYLDEDGFINLARMMEDDPLCSWCHECKKQPGTLCCSECRSLKEQGLTEKDNGSLVAFKIPKKGSPNRLMWDVYMKDEVIR